MWNVLRSVIFGDGTSSRFAESRRRQKAMSPVVVETQLLENREVMSATTIHNWNDELLEAILWVTELAHSIEPDPASPSSARTEPMRLVVS